MVICMILTASMITQEPSKMVAVLSIALLSIFILLILNFIKVYKLKKENQTLKEQLKHK
jgi:hypothetical protein